MKPFFVVGTSMWPVLKSGDCVLTQHKAKLEPGDLVMRVIEGTPTVHRFLRHGITKGDRTSLPDDPCSQIEFTDSGVVVVGLVPRRFFRFGGQTSMFLLNGKLHSLVQIQTWLSQSQLLFGARTVKLFFLAGLIINGHLLRSLYYLKKKGSFDVNYQA